MTTPRLAIERGDTAAVALMLDNGLDPNLAVDEHDTSALTLAAFQGHVALVGELLRRGAEIDRPNMHGSRPLGAATRNGKLEVIRALLQAGASPTSEATGGNSAFLDAAAGAPQVVEVFLAHGVNVNGFSSKGYTALHNAARNVPHGPGVIRLLLAAGAAPSLEDAAGRTPRDVAVELGLAVNAAALHGAGPSQR
jgi:ankyrin repeat protein